jgi:hypothetical protein
MHKIFLFPVHGRAWRSRLAVALICFSPGCVQNQPSPTPPASVAPSTPPSASQWHNTDTLTSGEKSFLARLAKESDVIVWATQVERYYKADSTLLYSKLLFPDGFLQEKGYVYFELGGAGKLTDAHITYNFSQGQANQGYGSVTGEDSSLYIHSVKGCGVTACIVQLFENGKKVYEKWKDIQ